MLIGAGIMVAFQVVIVDSTFKSINLDVMGFLFRMFSIVSALNKFRVHQNNNYKDVVNDKQSSSFNTNGICCLNGITFCISGK